MHNHDKDKIYCFATSKNNNIPIYLYNLGYNTFLNENDAC